MKRALAMAVLGVVTFILLSCFQDFDGFANGGAAPDAALRDSSSPEASTDPTDATAAPDVAVTDAYAAAVRADNPSSWYRLEDPAGSTTIKDETGAHPGAVYGTLPLGVPGAVGNAASFDGTNGFTIGDVFDFAGTSDFTIELWGQNDDATDVFETAIGKRMDDPSAENGWVVFVDTRDERSVQFQFWAGGNVNEQATTDVWMSGLHHVVITRSASGDNLSLAIYLDGHRQTKNANFGSQGAEPDTAQGLKVGSSWHGVLDEVAFYDHALTDDRVAAHFNAAPKH